MYTYVNKRFSFSQVIDVCRTFRAFYFTCFSSRLLCMIKTKSGFMYDEG